MKKTKVITIMVILSFIVATTILCVHEIRTAERPPQLQHSTFYITEYVYDGYTLIKTNKDKYYVTDEKPTLELSIQNDGLRRMFSGKIISEKGIYLSERGGGDGKVAYKENENINNYENIGYYVEGKGLYRIDFDYLMLGDKEYFGYNPIIYIEIK